MLRGGREELSGGRCLCSFIHVHFLVGEKADADKDATATAERKCSEATDFLDSVQDSLSRCYQRLQEPDCRLQTSELWTEAKVRGKEQYVPVERMRLRDGSVEPAGSPGADHLKQEHDAVPRLLGDG